MKSRLFGLFMMLAVSAFGLAGCGDSGGDAASTKVLGAASKGPIAGGTVQFFALNASGVAVEPALTTTPAVVTTNAFGNYSATISYSGPLKITVTGGTYTDEATNTPGTALVGALEAVANVSTPRVTIPVTALTTLASQKLATATGADVAAKINAANAGASALVNSLLGITGFDVLSDPASDNYKFALGVVSQYASNTEQSLSNALATVLAGIDNNGAVTDPALLSNINKSITDFSANPNNPTPIDFFDINATVGAGGTITPAGHQAIASGGSATFAIAASANFVIADVLVDGVSQGAITTFTFSNVTANHTISATFTPTFSITATAGANGAISPSSATVVQGNNQTFTITANNGFGISDVLVDGVSQGAISTFTFSNVTANHTISASFISQPTTAIVKVATSGTLPQGVLIGGITANLNYATNVGLSIAANNVAASGVGVGSTLIPNVNTAGTVVLGLVNATGIGTGEFATATFSIAAGNFPTSGNFTIAANPTIIDVNGQAIAGITVVVSSVTIQ